MERKKIPDIVGLKLSAAAEILGAAGVSFETEELRPQGVRKRENEQEKAGVMRVVRQRLTPENTLILSVCNIYEG